MYVLYMIVWLLLIYFQYISNTTLTEQCHILVGHESKYNTQTKQSVPDDQHASVVSVQAVPIAPMMYAMMTRGVHYPFQGTQGVYNLTTGIHIPGCGKLKYYLTTFIRPDVFKASAGKSNKVHVLLGSCCIRHGQHFN